MKLLNQIPESAMVATFLKAELRSERFSKDVRNILKSFGVQEAIITIPDISDKQENVLREKVLGEWRGFRKNIKIFKDFTDDLNWYEADISREEIGSLRYVDYSYWNELTDQTHLVKDAVANIQKGKIVFGVNNDRFLRFADEIRNGKLNFEPMILWGVDINSKLTILEGHLRATAFGLAGRDAPPSIRVIVGLISQK